MYSPEFYHGLGYNTQKRYLSYHAQVSEVVNLRARSVLYVGIGSGIVPSILRGFGVDVRTVDNNKMLCPDYLCDIKGRFPSDRMYDVVMLCEVLEHVPMIFFNIILEELRFITSYIIISVPDRTPAIDLSVNGRGAFVQLPLKSGPGKIGHDHVWEIGDGRNDMKAVSEMIESKKWDIIKTYRVTGNQYHRFFVLKKREG